MKLVYRSEIVRSLAAEHIILLYHHECDRDDAVIRYINEGLKRNQLCMFATVNIDEKIIAKMMTEIIDYEENVKKGNLLMKALKPFNSAPVRFNLSQFEDIKRQLDDMRIGRNDKRIRFVGDFLGFLFETKKFDECKFLEEWWQVKPFEGSYVCLYHDSILNEYPFSEHKDRIFHSHDKVILA